MLYCLSEKLGRDHCRINYSPGIFIATCCFSILKCLYILAAALRYREKTLSTVGGAIDSFLAVPDPASAHMGPVTKSMFTTRDTSVWTEDSRLK